MSLNVTVSQGVGRRILTLLLVAAVVPALFTAGLAYVEIERSARDDAVNTLRGSAKAYGMELFARLQRAANSIDDWLAAYPEARIGNAAAHAYLFDGFEAVAAIDRRGEYRQLHGTARIELSGHEIDREFLADHIAQFIVDSSVESRPLIMASLADGGSVVLFKLRAESFWRPAENSLYATDFCAVGAGVRLYCTSPDTAPEAALVSGDDASGEWPAANGEKHLGVAWQLFLRGGFAAPSLDVIAYQPKTHALRSGADFQRVFWPAFALVLVLVGVLTSKLAQQSLVPLQRLTRAARDLAAGDLSTRVSLDSRDEFESLGRAFNNMAQQLGTQISTLEAMSEIDRLILGKLKLEDVAERVLRHLRELALVEATAVIARDPQTPYRAQMITMCGESLTKEIVSVPTEPGHIWCQLRGAALEELDTDLAPYKARFEALGKRYVFLVPVILEYELKGVLILGSGSPIDPSESEQKNLVEVAARLAVALAGVEREEALYRQAHYDELTTLPNRQLLTVRLRQELARSRREGDPGAMLFMDLDRFKEINDVYGHSVGDTVLTQAAKRIVNEVRSSDTVARLGGDEFVIVMPGVDEPTVAAMATRLLARLSESFSAGGVDHYLAASIGIVMFPVDGDSVETLLKNADSAMYRAKDAGRARFEFFSQELNAESHRKIVLERDLRHAFYDDGLEIHYQPQFDLKTGVLSGAEALLRWDHPDKGSISPAEFVPLAEETGLIVEMGRWALRRACRDLRGILDLGLHPGPISINVSARQLRDPSFENDVLSPLNDYGVHPGYLQIEVTETAVAQNKDIATHILTSLREHGVRVSIDDFGTGYSSLSYLQQMPFDLLKIDMSFVQKIGKDETSDNICRTIIRMAHELGKDVLAEGVETTAQDRFLVENGCDFVQGYLHAEALNPADFAAFVKKQDFHTQRRRALQIVNS